MKNMKACTFELTPFRIYGRYWKIVQLSEKGSRSGEFKVIPQLEAYFSVDSFGFTQVTHKLENSFPIRCFSSQSLEYRLNLFQDLASSFL